MNVLVNLVTVGYTLFFIEEQNVQESGEKVVTKFLNYTCFSVYKERKLYHSFMTTFN